MRIRRPFPALFLTVALAGPAGLGTVACGKSVGNTIDDATITGRVKTSMLNDPDVAGLKIDVDTFKGVVTLSGAVKSQMEATKAIDIARKTPGVSDVKSTLQVNPERSALAESGSGSLAPLAVDPHGRERWLCRPDSPCTNRIAHIRPRDSPTPELEALHYWRASCYRWGEDSKETHR